MGRGGGRQHGCVCHRRSTHSQPPQAASSLKQHMPTQRPHVTPMPAAAHRSTKSTSTVSPGAASGPLPSASTCTRTPEGVLKNLGTGAASGGRLKRGGSGCHGGFLLCKRLRSSVLVQPAHPTHRSQPAALTLAAWGPPEHQDPVTTSRRCRAAPWLPQQRAAVQPPQPQAALPRRAAGPALCGARVPQALCARGCVWRDPQRRRRQAAGGGGGSLRGRGARSACR